MSLWLPVAAWMAVIFCFSSAPGNKIPHIFSFQDIVGHLLMYAVLGFLIKRALRRSWKGRSAAARLVLTVIFAFMYGSIDEFHQSFVPQRSATIADALIDAAGGLIGALLYR